MPHSRKLKSFLFLLIFSSSLCLPARAADYRPELKKFQKWLVDNRDEASGLTYSHVGDKRLVGWVVTYDSSVTLLAHLALGHKDDAKRIADFYLSHPKAWRLGGLIEAVDPANSVLGEDWSVRTGSNLWMGIAAFHLYEATRDVRYLNFSEKLADFALSLEDLNEKDLNFGAVRMGPLGNPDVPSDQHFFYDKDEPRVYDVFSTEHNIDAYALFRMLYQTTGEKKYGDAQRRVLGWLKTVAYNRQEHRFNRGANGGPDTAVATDVQSWGISALGVNLLDGFEPGAAEKMAAFVEKNCQANVTFRQLDGHRLYVTGVDFVDAKTAAELNRAPLISPEWTFQFCNAYRRLQMDYARRGDRQRSGEYYQKRGRLIQNMLRLAFSWSDALAYPYATTPNAVIGHEYNTPDAGNLSTIGVAYAVLVLTNNDPLLPVHLSLSAPAFPAAASSAPLAVAKN